MSTDAVGSPDPDPWTCHWFHPIVVADSLSEREADRGRISGGARLSQLRRAPAVRRDFPPPRPSDSLPVSYPHESGGEPHYQVRQGAPHSEPCISGLG